MSKQTYHTWLHRLFCLLMALHVINMSVDAPDGYSSHYAQGGTHEDLSVNDIESLSELVMEVCFGMTNAIPEHDESDDESSLTELEQDYIFTPSFVFVPFPSPVYHLVRNSVSFQPTDLPTPVAEIIAPPPQQFA